MGNCVHLGHFVKTVQAPSALVLMTVVFYAFHWMVKFFALCFVGFFTLEKCRKSIDAGQFCAFHLSELCLYLQRPQTYVLRHGL